MRNKKIAGVTLLEVMLVLAIAAMVIVMSIRYYKAATASAQANAALSQIQAITATADDLAMAKGSYMGVISTSALERVLGSVNMRSPTNGLILVTSVQVGNYSISMPLTPEVCASVLAKLRTNPHFDVHFCTLGTLTYTYVKNPGLL